LLRVRVVVRVVEPAPTPSVRVVPRDTVERVLVPTVARPVVAEREPDERLASSAPRVVRVVPILDAALVPVRTTERFPSSMVTPRAPVVDATPVLRPPRSLLTSLAMAFLPIVAPRGS
jgi:hypothetical protein